MMITNLSLLQLMYLISKLSVEAVMRLGNIPKKCVHPLLQNGCGVATNVIKTVVQNMEELVE